MLGGSHYRAHSGTTVFVKSVASTVALAFSMLLLTPTVVAARDRYEGSRRLLEAAPRSEARLGHAVVEVRRVLGRLQGRLAGGEDERAARRELRRLRGEIARLEQPVLEGFARVERRLRQRGLPEVILQRHRAMVEHYREQAASLLADLDHIWVEAAIDYEPSRGAVNRAPDSWVALDPSYKQYEQHYILAVGLLSSARSHAIPEQLFDDPDDAHTPEAVSAVKALQKANAAGQRIYRTTQANANTAPQELQREPATLDEISKALHAGREVITTPSR